jgi:hypothetical protein
MASVAVPGPESVVTVKINYDGCTRRAKMVLRDMVPMQLESQVSTDLTHLLRPFVRLQRLGNTSLKPLYAC